MAILNRENWHKAMCSRSVEHGVTTTPLRKMIMKEPGELLKKENCVSARCSVKIVIVNLLVAKWFNCAYFIHLGKAADS